MSAVTSTSSAVNSAITSQSGSSSLDKEAFMLLLVTQFQYQDPLNPMEDKEFIAQLAQFSSLEQMMNMNESMQTLTDATKSQEMINATSFIGKNVDITGTTIHKGTDANGNPTVGTLEYGIGETAISGRVRITDSSGQEVFSETLSSRSVGPHTYQWDGKMANGADAPEGSYNINLELYNAEGNTIQYDAIVDGLVTGVVTSGGITYLSLSDGRNTPLSQVRRVSEPVTVNTSTDTDEDKDEDKENTTTTTDTSTTTTDTGTATTAATTDTGTTTAATNTTDTKTTDATTTGTGTTTI